MRARKVPKRQRAAVPSALAGNELQLGTATVRFSALLRKRDEILKQIAAKKKLLEAEGEAIRETISRLAGQIPDLIERQRRIVGELDQLVSELLADPKLPQRARRLLLELAAGLELDAPFDGAGPGGFPHPEYDFEEPPKPARDAANPHDARDQASAEHAGGQAGRSSVRDVFRRLAIALHPDRAQHEVARTERTEVMKQVTRAYEEGDLARLLQIESEWLRGNREEGRSGDLEARIAALEATIQELRAQHKAVRRELDELRKGDPFRSFGAFGVRVPRGVDAVEYLTSAMSEELDQAERIRDFVRDFRDRKINLKQFVQGPPGWQPISASELLEDELLSVVIDGMMNDTDFGAPPARRGRSTTPKRAPRKPHGRTPV